VNKKIFYGEFFTFNLSKFPTRYNSKEFQKIGSRLYPQTKNIYVGNLTF
jgi:hypothetical protein